MSSIIPPPRILSLQERVEIDKLNREWFPNRTQTEIPLDSLKRTRCRTLEHEVGMREFAERIYAKKVRPLGIRFWRSLVMKEAHLRRFVTDEETVSRTINEIAKKEYFDPPFWLCLLPKWHEDEDPDAPVGSPWKFQSPYIPNPELFTYWAELLEPFTGRQVELET